MTPSESLRLFISYARRDGSALAQRLESDLIKYGFDVCLDTQRIEGGAVWSAEIEREIDTRQVTLALLSPGSYSSEICRAEQLRALDKGNRVIPVLAVKGSDRPLYLYARQFRDFTKDADYPERLRDLLADIRGGATATLPEAYRKTRVTYLTAPPRVANYLERPEALRALRDALFDEDHRQSIALTALAGMGGIGKTVLAKALTEDEVVQRAFPDGIVWITASKERKRDFIEEMRQIAEVLGDDTNLEKKVTDWQDEYRIRIAGKAALIVVDDVWSKSDIEPLLAESTRSRFLFTTRDTAIGNSVGARDHRADLLDISQSRELLASWANKPFANLPAVAELIIHECGRLPLALSVVGGMLRDKNAAYWADTLNRLSKADLSSIKRQLPRGQESFFKAVETSFQSLEPQMREQYKALAVLLEDMASPLPILEVLWNADAAETRLISSRLVDLSLAQSDDGGESIRLHDLQLDYVRAQFPDNQALELIHEAVRLSAHVTDQDPNQFASQIVGRLLPYRGMPAIDEFSGRVVEGAGRCWLRPLHSALHPAGTTLVGTLDDRSGYLNGIALTADGRLAVSASRGRILTVWEVQRNGRLRRLKGHTGSVNAVAVSPNGHLAVSASDDKTLRVWDLQSGKQLHMLKGHAKAVNGVAMGRNGRIAVSASDDKTLRVWNLQSGKQLDVLEGHRKAVNDVAVSEDGAKAISASDDKTLIVWDLQSGEQLHMLKGHAKAVNGVAMSSNGRLAVSASSDKKLKIWDVEVGREVGTLGAHPRPVKSVGMSRDGERAVSGCADHNLKVWDVAGRRELGVLEGHNRAVYSVAVSADGRFAVSASRDKTAKVWDLSKALLESPPKHHERRVLGLAASEDGRLLVSASSDKTLKVWDAQSGRVQHPSLKGHDYAVRSVAVLWNGKAAISASSDKTLRLWNLETGGTTFVLTGHDDDVYGVAVSGNGRLAVSASHDNTLKLWNLETCRELRTLKGHSQAVRAVAISRDGNFAVSGSSDNTLRVWDLKTGRTRCELSGHRRYVNSVALTRDGKGVVSGSWDNTVKVWDVKTGHLLHTFQGHSGYVYGVAVSQDSSLAASASLDNTVKVWDLETGVPLATFTCDTPACCCLFLNNRDVVAGDAGGRVHFLRLEGAAKHQTMTPAGER